MSAIIQVTNISKQYRLGQVGTGTISHDLNRWWHRVRGKEDPYIKIGEENDRSKKGESDYAWALRDINFEVQQGEVLGIIGRNGAGKSTLLKILSRTTSPTTGQINIKGRVASLLEVGTGFHPELTGRENIFLNGAILGMTKQEIKRKFDEIVDFAGVERYIDTPVKRYSSGMYVRLAFAVSANLESEILIVDEVLAVGDTEFQKKCLGKMNDVSKGEGRTVLFVSHDMQAVSTLTTKAIFLNQGVIVKSGYTREIIKLYIDSKKATGLEYVADGLNKDPHVSKINLETSLPNNHQLNGDKMQVIVTLTSHFPIKGACFSIQFVDSKERNFSHFWIFDKEIEYCRESGTYQLTCSIPALRLYMGKYYLKCYFSEGPGGRVFEVLENICPFEVKMYDSTREEFQWYPEACAYIEESKWDVKKLEHANIEPFQKK